MIIIFFDTETTGSGTVDRLLQLAVKERGSADPLVNDLFKPPVPIAIEAMEVHHVTEQMVTDKPYFMVTPAYKDIKTLFEDPGTIAVAHNAAFDIGMLAKENVFPCNTICTYKVAKALDPEETLGAYRLQYLRYLLDLGAEGTAHDAWGDVVVLEALFERLLAKMTSDGMTEQEAVDSMVEISKRPMLFTTIRFGKHKGKKIADVVRDDRGYIEWLLREKQKDASAETDWIYSLEYHLS